MQALAKFQVEKTAFGAAVRQLLVSQAGVDAASVTEGDNFAVWPRPGGDAFVGISPLLSVAGSTTANAATVFPSQSSEVRAATMQWCTLAAQLSASQVTLADVEARANIPPGIPKGFIVGTDAPCAADLLLLSSIKGNMKQCKIEAPNVYKWAEKILKQNEICQQFGSLQASEEQGAAAAASGKDTAKKAGGAGADGKQEFAIPNAAEIAARRAAKEQAKKEKAEKEAAAAAAAGGAAPPAPAPKKAGGKADANKELTPDEGLDLRVGRITAVANHPTADRLYVETIDLGEASGPRTIISGLVQFYKPEELQNQLVVVVTNMKPKKLQGTESHGMVLCASTEAAVKFIQPPANSKVGDCVAFGKNVEAAKPDKAIPSSNKMGQLLEGLRADENGIVMWKDLPLTVGGEQPVTSVLAGVPVK